MKGNVNPFMPWRPTETPVPPRLHASRPWRPPATRAGAPPVLEPVEVLPKMEPPRPPTRKSRRADGPRLRPTATNRPRFFPGFSMGILMLLIVLAVSCLGWLRESHLPRLAVIGGGAALLLGISLSRQRAWPERLTWMASALAFAGLAAWLVPTSNGVSLWSAYRYVEELRTLPAGDFTAYQRDAAMRQAIAAEFPSFVAEIAHSEKAWLLRTADDIIEKSDRKLADDPNKALADLHQASERLARLDTGGRTRKDLEAARRRAVQACLRVAQK